MERRQHWFRVEIDLEFTREEIRLLSECSRNHYDLKCRAQDECGFINGLRNTLETDVTTYRFTWNLVDLAAKITEGGYHLSPKEHEKVHEMNFFFHETLKHLAKLQQEANPWLRDADL